MGLWRLDDPGVARSGLRGQRQAGLQPGYDRRPGQAWVAEAGGAMGVGGSQSQGGTMTPVPDDLPSLIAESKEIVCKNARTALWLHRVEKVCRQYPQLSWRSDPWLRIKLRWFYWNYLHYVRQGLRAIKPFDPEWSAKAWTRFQQELERPAKQLIDGSIVAVGDTEGESLS
jgi:hypothetical protein